MRRAQGLIGVAVAIALYSLNSCSVDESLSPGDQDDPSGQVQPDGGERSDAGNQSTDEGDGGATSGLPDSDSGVAGTTGLADLRLTGSACVSAADCDLPDAVCVTPESGEWGEGGPARGYCTAACIVPQLVDDIDPCSRADANSACYPTECVDIDQNNLCFLSGEPDQAGYCVARCQRGTPATADEKCHGRLDLACATDPAAGPLGFCDPSCGNDTECPAGFGCSLVSGRCEPAPVDINLGDPCNPNISGSCPGICLAVGTNAGFCSGYCTIGSLSACGFAQSPLGAFCYEPVDSTLSAPSQAILDLGLCVPTCDCNDDCPASTVCNLPGLSAQANADFQERVGRAGLCFPAETPADPDAGPVIEGITTCP